MLEKLTPNLYRKCLQTFGINISLFTVILRHLRNYVQTEREKFEVILCLYAKISHLNFAPMHLEDTISYDF